MGQTWPNHLMSEMARSLLWVSGGCLKFVGQNSHGNCMESTHPETRVAPESVNPLGFTQEALQNETSLILCSLIDSAFFSHVWWISHWENHKHIQTSLSQQPQVPFEHFAHARKNHNSPTVQTFLDSLRAPAAMHELSGGTDSVKITASQ